ncbi:MAG: hypothetical protein ACT4N2_02885 [Hyphomicrobium sp.]
MGTPKLETATEATATAPRSASTTLGWLGELGVSLATFAAATVAGFVLLVALFKSGVFGGIDILFYRGLVLCAIAAPLTALLTAAVLRRLGRSGLRDATAAAVLSLGVNLSVLVILPVTVDRSVSVFVLGYMNAHAGEAMTPAEVDAGFRRIYLDRLHQIDRRLKEQTISGNLVEKDGRYTISDQGRAFMRTASWIAWAFDTDRRLIERRPEEEHGGLAQAAR